LALHADLIFRGGPVFTGRRRSDGTFELSEAVAVRDGRIVAVGSDTEISSLAGPKTRVIELAGRLLSAGLIDAHVHLVTHGTNQMGVCCKYPVVRSIEDIKERIRERARQTPPGQWIRGWGYNQFYLAERRHPNRWDLDEAAPDHPVVIVRTDYHIAAVNSRALEILGIGDRDPDPPGGEMERQDGIVTGVLKEQAYMKHADTMGYSDEEMVEGARIAAADFIARGLTSIHDAGGAQARNIRALQTAVERGHCPVRVYMLLWSFYEDRALHEAFFASGLRTGFGSDRLKVGPYKIMVDGSSSGPTAATREPYASMPDYRGILHFSEEEVVERMVEAQRRGFDCTAHAVGDRAIDIVLRAYEEGSRRYPRADARHRIEHAAMAAPDLQERMARLGIVPVAQPTWFYEFGDGYIVNYGEERLRHFKPLRSWLRRGIVPAMSTDCPVANPDPLRNIHAATTRRTAGGSTLPGDETVSVAEALWMYTYGGARAAKEEHIKGTIEPGKLADLVVFSDNLLALEGDDLLSVRVDLTVVDGQIVYER